MKQTERSPCTLLTSEPKDEGSQNLKSNTVRLEGVGLLERVSIFVVKSAFTRSEDNRGNKGSATTVKYLREKWSEAEVQSMAS
jgi:hypothetical protein